MAVSNLSDADVARGVIGRWTPANVTVKLHEVEWDVTRSVNGPGEFSIEFKYDRGLHRLDLKWVALVVDGSEVDRDTHNGTTGGRHSNNTYVVSLRAYDPDARYVLRARVRSDGGSDSYGTIRILDRNQQTATGVSPLFINYSAGVPN